MPLGNRGELDDAYPNFTIKDSGARAEFDSGMVRDVEDDKIDWTLVFDGPMLKRYAEHLTKGAKKYSPRNWMKATGDAEYDRFKRSLLRHLVAYLNGETDEDHAAAVIFNLNGMEYVKGIDKIRSSVAQPLAAQQDANLGAGRTDLRRADRASLSGGASA